MKFPYKIIKKKEYRELTHKLSRCTSRLHYLQEDLEKAKKLAKEILPRLFNIKVYDRDFKEFRVCVELHRDMVERGFTHGGDEQQIRYLAEMLCHEIERKMIQFNFARCER